MKIKRSVLKEMIKEEMMGEGHRNDNPRFVYAAQILRSAIKLPPDEDGYVSYKFDTIDGGELYVDTMSNEEEPKMTGFSHMNRSENTQELQQIIENLQAEYHDYETIFNSVRSLIGKVKAEPEEPEEF